MIARPQHFSPQNALSFQDQSVVAAYRYRPPYPDEIFTILLNLITATPRRVLDVGCGTGELARRLAPLVDQVDAADFSQAMIAEGKQLPGGDHPHLRWWPGRIEEVALDPPYSLVIAGASLHWLDWPVVLPRFRSVLLPDSYLAIVTHGTKPDPWSLLQNLVTRYRTDGGYQPFDLLAELTDHALFHQIGEQQTKPIPFVQSIDDSIESYHSRSGFSRERMGIEQANAFDQEAHAILHAAYPEGQIPLEVVGSVVWGFPGTGLIP
jgi:SAM-dependent methyltransferase